MADENSFLGDLPPLSHPRCTCTDLSRADHSHVIMVLTKVLDEIVVQALAINDMCPRDGVMAAVTLASSILHRLGFSDEELETEMREAVDVVLAHRLAFREWDKAVKEEPPKHKQH